MRNDGFSGRGGIGVEEANALPNGGKWFPDTFMQQVDGSGELPVALPCRRRIFSEDFRILPVMGIQIRGGQVMPIQIYGQFFKRLLKDLSVADIKVGAFKSLPSERRERSIGRKGCLVVMQDQFSNALHLQFQAYGF